MNLYEQRCGRLQKSILETCSEAVGGRVNFMEHPSFPSSLLEFFRAKYALDLHGLELVTEAANGAYAWNIFLPILSGASHVHTIVRDSRYGCASEIKREVLKHLRFLQKADRVTFYDRLDDVPLERVDIITNSGFVRPITRNHIERLKFTAVIPLMWETWEWRPDEVALDAAKEHGILVLGTIEDRPPCDIARYMELFLLQQLFAMNCDIADNHVLVFGSQSLPADRLRHSLERFTDRVVQFGAIEREGVRPYESARGYVSTAAPIDLIVIAEHSDERLLIGEGAVISAEEIIAASPLAKVFVITGNVDADHMRACGLRFHPQSVSRLPQMTISPATLGPRPVLDLYAGGICVGQAMARARLAGNSVRMAAERAIVTSPAMDFGGENSWLSTNA